MQWYAHSGNDDLKSDWQRLSDHLFSVAKLAAECARPIGLEKAAFIAGLFHDLGKYNVDFQRRLEGINISVDHSTAGAQVLAGLTSGYDKAIAEIVNYCILGHHAGLPDRMNGTRASYNQRMQTEISIAPAWREELNHFIGNDTVTGLVPTYAHLFSKDDANDAGFSFSVMGRFIFSCLVDSDFKDTERFYIALGNIKADRNWPKLSDLLADFTQRFDAHMAQFADRAGDLNQLRRKILTYVREQAEKKPGLFTLTVPTGGGKTLASLGFSLDHARKHGHQRIIYAIPFTSTIDQTAAIFRDILGADYILEHHSSIDDENPTAKTREQRDKLKLAMEDWAAPVMVTTNVQLFEACFPLAHPAAANYTISPILSLFWMRHRPYLAIFYCRQSACCMN